MNDQIPISETVSPSLSLDHESSGQWVSWSIFLPFQVLLLLFFLLLLIGCSSNTPKEPQQRYEAAKTLFDQTTKQFHIPSAEAKEAEKQRLLQQAVAGYEQLLKKYPEQDYWAAQALRNLAGVKAAQGRLEEAVKLYASVETRYPKQEWELLLAWKAAADLLWENGRKEQAKIYYQKVVSTFDKPEAPQVVKAVVSGAKLRLGEGK